MGLFLFGAGAELGQVLPVQLERLTEGGFVDERHIVLLANLLHNRRDSLCTAKQVTRVSGVARYAETTRDGQRTG